MGLRPRARFARAWSSAISDHSAIYLTRKVTHLGSNMHKNVEVRQLNNFNEAEFLRDLRLIDWNRDTTHNNPNKMWDFWKHLLASVIEKHAHHSEQKVSPWITNEPSRKIVYI